MKAAKAISIKSPEEIVILKEGGSVLAKIVGEVKCSLKIGITTKAIDNFVEELMKKYGVQSAFKGYKGFPANLCISVNQEVVHGIPTDKVLRQGDLVSIDIGIIYKGYYVDMAISLGMGKCEAKVDRLIDITRQSLYKGIEQAKVNNHLSDISHAIQKYVESHKFSVVRDFVGHGIGKELHEDPEIPNFGQPHQGPLLKEGMVLAIEPMVNIGSWQTKILKDGWTVVTKDSQPSAHFEHTILITNNSPEILTTI